MSDLSKQQDTKQNYSQANAGTAWAETRAAETAAPQHATGEATRHSTQAGVNTMRGRDVEPTSEVNGDKVIATPDEVAHNVARNSPRRHSRGLSDKLRIAFHHACDNSDLEVAERLLTLVEIMLMRRYLHRSQSSPQHRGLGGRSRTLLAFAKSGGRSMKIIGSHIAGAMFPGSSVSIYGPDGDRAILLSGQLRNR